MKKNILFFCSLFFVGSFSLQAQILVEPEVVNAAFLSEDLSNYWLDLESEISVTNTTNDPIEIKWTREISPECAEDWDTQICDNNSCYLYQVYSNIADDLALDVPFILEGGEAFDSFLLHVLPREVAGCCEAKVHFSLVDNPDEILATVTFNISINDNSCGFVNPTKEELAAANISIFPNPAFDRFILTNNDVVKNLTVYNVLGNKVKSFSYSNSEYFDVADLPNGLYFVGLQGENGHILKTIRLTKQGILP